MGEKDIAEKMLEDYNDIFADIMNVILFHGEQIVNEVLWRCFNQRLEV